MTVWKLYAQRKKSTVERELYVKDGQELWVETGWRGGDFVVTTTDDNPPEIDVDNPNGLSIYDYIADTIEEVELNGTYDGCWTDIEFPDSMPEVDQERLQELIDENGYYDALSDEGWDQVDSEMWLYGPLTITDENDNIVLEGKDTEN